MKRSRYQKIVVFAVILLSALQMIACGSGGDEEADNDPVTPKQFTLSGTIKPSGFYAVDGDVNDPNADYNPNDTFAQAQQLYFPVTLAGYVNFAGQGERGRSFATGDTSDFYRIVLSEGDSIALYIANPHSTDLDVYLYRADSHTLVDASMGTGSSESLRAPDDDEFILEVRTVSYEQLPVGASNYNLIVGDATEFSDLATFRLSHDFIPGEIVLRYADEPAVSLKAHSYNLQCEKMGMKRIRGEAGREMLFSFESGAQTQSVFNALNIQPSSQTRVLSNIVSEKMQCKIDTLTVVKALKKRMDVHSVAPNFIRRPLLQPDDNYFNLQWNYNLIHLPEAWETVTGNGEVLVAVVDTGVLFGHPDLGARLTSDGYDFISSFGMEGNEPASERGGIDPNPEDPGDQAAGGSSFHGTHVAGTIAAATDNTIGVAGVGWDSTRIIPLRALGIGGGTSYDILQAVRYAAGLPNDSGTVPEAPADIINLSFGGTGFSAEEQSLYETIKARGTLVFAAAGNQASSEKLYPAAYEGVISVSAVDFSSNPAYYSNYGNTIDIAAPGGDNTADLNSDGHPDGILSTIGDDTSGSVEMGYHFSQGTSMAVPHVAGVAALMKALWPEMGYAEFDNLLRSGRLTTDLGSSGKDDFYGYGLIDAQKAVLAAQSGVLPTSLIVSPPTLHFGTELSTMNLWLEKSGDADDNLSVTSIKEDADWITVEPSQINNFGLGSYTVSVDRSGLSEGVYNGNIEILSTANSVNVYVSMQVSQASRTIDAGHHYVLLLNPSNNDPLAQTEAILIDGIYYFDFLGVEGGEYLLFAGTDMDNDYVIGDVGNAIGAYLSIDQPVVLHVDKDRFDLDFKTEFNINLFDYGSKASEQLHGVARRVENKGVRNVK